MTVVTQNIDGLHEEAGSTRVLQIHGTLLRIVWAADKQLLRKLQRAELEEIVRQLQKLRETGAATMSRILSAVRPIFGLGHRGLYRPDVVLFGDEMAEPDWRLAQDAARALRIWC